MIQNVYSHWDAHGPYHTIVVSLEKMRPSRLNVELHYTPLA